MTSAVRHLTEAGFLGKLHIDGEWRKPIGSATAVVVNPATEQPSPKSRSATMRT
jgi:hypothetical protein